MGNEKFINGEWYEEEYSKKESLYYQHYIEKDQPLWAKQMNQHCIDLTIAYTGISSDARVLDLGSGVGRDMEAWQSRGYDICGIDISKTAVKSSGQSKMVCGSVVDMSCFKDKQFDLIYSAALFEHIDSSIFEKVFKECCRIGDIQVHLISQDKGTDPSHINIKIAEEWAWDFYSLTTDHKIFLIPNLLEKGHPLVVIYPDNKELPYQLNRYRYINGEPSNGVVFVN